MCITLKFAVLKYKKNAQVFSKRETAHNFKTHTFLPFYSIQEVPFML